MKIFTAKQIREGDAYTIRHEPINSIDLMERAAGQCVEWLTGHFPETQPFYIFCGAGNNGGDGLAITRLLHERGFTAFAYLVGNSDRFSDDCKINRNRLEHQFGEDLLAIHHPEDFPELPDNAVIVDALFGTGLNRPLAGLVAEVVLKINKQNKVVIAIDMPSGLMADQASGSNIITATHTLSFEFHKLAFLLPENAAYTGKVHILPIGIHYQYIEKTPASFEIVEGKNIRSVYKKRLIFSHKGTYGHALLMVGSYGKIGAAVLAAKACLRSGVGLVTGYVPLCGYNILQAVVPEAMCICDPSDQYLSGLPEEMGRFDVIGIGPGIGMENRTIDFLREVLTKYRKPLVLDADALNIIGMEKLLKTIPPGSVLTPHPKEFERLFGKTNNGFERLALQIEQSKRLGIYIVLKGHYTCTSTPEGHCYFNSTGNPGMATGGSGDVLTGVLTGLMAQGYTPLEASILGIYLHGLAGNIAAEENSMESMTASDIISSLGKAFLKIESGL